MDFLFTIEIQFVKRVMSLLNAKNKAYPLRIEEIGFGVRMIMLCRSGLLLPD